MKLLKLLFEAVVILAMLVLIVLIATSCKYEEAKIEVTTTTTVKEQKSIPLSWEIGSVDRSSWSSALKAYIKKDIYLYESALDIESLCPKFKELDDDLKVQAVAEFYVALSKFESNWNPKSQSVDVGNKNNKDTWSIGLYQVSVVDQSWAGGNTKYTYDQLLTPIPNIHLANLLVTRWLKKENYVFLHNSSKNRYFAVALIGNKYSKVKEIKVEVLKAAPFCEKGKNKLPIVVL